MHKTGNLLVSRVTCLWAVLAITLPVAGAAHADDCLICDREVVLDQKLAACFLSRYDILQTKRSEAVAVDLTDCPDVDNKGQEQERGVIEALTMPQGQAATPDPTFMITRSQLSCLKHRLEEPGMVLDPAARIALDDCE